MATHEYCCPLPVWRAVFVLECKIFEFLTPGKARVLSLFGGRREPAASAHHMHAQATIGCGKVLREHVEGHAMQAEVGTATPLLSAIKHNPLSSITERRVLLYQPQS